MLEGDPIVHLQENPYIVKKIKVDGENGIEAEGLEIIWSNFLRKENVHFDLDTGAMCHRFRISSGRLKHPGKGFPAAI